ncbi:hypothetical protein SAMN05443665_102989 [Actinomadura meyerae]|uniref:Uncharacterized protein n=1 Tax=Actinomadura meyerae TaxID=240840 RepID=A0A239MM60_9ACTN|nr:hypothetical protein SAMN05443665_102989 [Actinomadura meyerae]
MCWSRPAMKAFRPVVMFCTTWTVSASGNASRTCRTKSWSSAEASMCSARKAVSRAVHLACSAARTACSGGELRPTLPADSSSSRARSDSAACAPRPTIRASRALAVPQKSVVMASTRAAATAPASPASAGSMSLHLPGPPRSPVSLIQASLWDGNRGSSRVIAHKDGRGKRTTDFISVIIDNVSDVLDGTVTRTGFVSRPPRMRKRAGEYLPAFGVVSINALTCGCAAGAHRDADHGQEFSGKRLFGVWVADGPGVADTGRRSGSLGQGASAREPRPGGLGQGVSVRGWSVGRSLGRRCPPGRPGRTGRRWR